MTAPLKQTQMSREIAEIPEVVTRQIEEGLELYAAAGRTARRSNPRGFVTCARGTSSHAAMFFKHLIETRTGLPVVPIGPSAASIYERPLRVEGFCCLAISQSGRSRDLVALQTAARVGGATTIAILNKTESPLGQGAETILPVFAGPELAVAATKSFVGSLVSVLGFVAGFTDDRALLRALRSQPDYLQDALECDWSAACSALARATSAFTMGRGPSLAIAAEAALKLKETCGIHAEAFSSAEVLHGPVTLADNNLAAIAFASHDRSQASIDDAARVMAKQGAAVSQVAAYGSSLGSLTTPHVPHPDLSPLAQISSFYCFVEHVARTLGKDPDAPVGLMKETSTL